MYASAWVFTKQEDTSMPFVGDLLPQPAMKSSPPLARSSRSSSLEKIEEALEI